MLSTCRITCVPNIHTLEHAKFITIFDDTWSVWYLLLSTFTNPTNSMITQLFLFPYVTKLVHFLVVAFLLLCLKTITKDLNKVLFVAYSCTKMRPSWPQWECVVTRTNHVDKAADDSHLYLHIRKRKDLGNGIWHLKLKNVLTLIYLLQKNHTVLGFLKQPSTGTKTKDSIVSD